MVDDVALRSAFRDFARAVLGPYDLDRMLYLLTDQVVGVLGVDGAGVSLATGDGTHLSFATATNDDIAAVEDAQVSVGEGPCHEAYRTGEQITRSPTSNSKSVGRSTDRSHSSAACVRWRGSRCR